MNLLARCLFVLLGSGLTASIGGASTVTSVSCSSPGGGYITSSASCYALGTEGYAQGGVTTGVSLPSHVSDAAVISADSTASALETTIRAITSTSTATSSANIGITFDTAGPVRKGLLELTFDQVAWTPPVNGYITESVSVASYSASPDGGSLSVWIPIQLGTDFGFAYQQSVIAISSGLTSGEIASEISLLAFAADGVTPVQLFDSAGGAGGCSLTPEPASLGLMVLAGVGGVILRKRE